MKVLRHLVSVILGLAIASCSGSGGRDGGSGGAAGGGSADGGGGGTGGAGGGGGLVPLSSFCAVAAITTCAHLSRCAQLATAQMADCRAQFEARCARKARASDAGSLRYDAVAATACVSSAYNPPCYGGPEDLYDCLDEVFPAGGRIGAPCAVLECIEGFCPAATGSDTTCRACTPYVAQGQPCTDPTSCNPAVGYCPLISTDGGTVVCEPLRGPGGDCLSGLECAGRASCVNFAPLDGGTSRCGPIALGNACTSAGDCGSGSYCKGLRIAADKTVTAGFCAARIPLNSFCVNEQYDDGCAGSGATCLGSKCITAAPHTRMLAEECDAYDHCPVGAYCTCVGPIADDGGISLRYGSCERQHGEDGGCTQAMEYSMCLPGFECLSHGHCGARRSEGQSCGTTGSCLSFLTCSHELTPLAFSCVAARKPGESCADVTLPCAAGSICLADAGVALGICSAPFSQGTACSNDVQCVSSRCLSGGSGKLCGAACY